MERKKKCIECIKVCFPKWVLIFLGIKMANFCKQILKPPGSFMQGFMAGFVIIVLSISLVCTVVIN